MNVSTILTLLRLLLDAVVEWIKEQGRVEVRDTIKEKTNETTTTFNRIDNGNLSTDDAFSRLRQRAGSAPPVGGGQQG